MGISRSKALRFCHDTGVDGWAAASHHALYERKEVMNWTFAHLSAVVLFICEII